MRSIVVGMEYSRGSSERRHGSLHSGCGDAASEEAALLMKELRKQMQEEQQQRAVAASCAAAAEAFPSAKRRLECRKVTPLKLKVVRNPVDRVTLVPVAASAAATPKASAASPVPDTAACGLSCPTTTGAHIDQVPDMVGPCGSSRRMKGSNSSCSNNNYSSTGNMRVELLDVSLGERHLEEKLLGACPELRLLLRRGLSLLQFTEMPTKEEEQPQTGQESNEHLQERVTYRLVRRGLPKFFDIDWESLACCFLRAFVQQEQQPKQEQQEQQGQQQRQQQQCREQRDLKVPTSKQGKGERQQQQQQPQGEQKVGQGVRQPVEQQQKEGKRGKQKKKQAQGPDVCGKLMVANDKSEETLLSSHQLSHCLLQCFATPTGNDDVASGSSRSGRYNESSKAGLVEVWALQKLNGESAQISFCSHLKAWACCSKNVCLFLPAASVSSSKHTMPGADAAPAAAARMGADHLQRCGQAVPQGTSQLQEQSNSEQQQQQQTKRQAVKLLRQLGSTFEEQLGSHRAAYALQVAAAWQHQLQQLTQTQAEEVEKLLQSHTLVGELIDCADKQHIVPAPKRQQHELCQQEGQLQEQQAGARRGRLAFFALVPHKLESVGTAFCEPPCLSPGVALPLLQSLGLETAEVAARLQATSPVELLLQLLRLECQREESSASSTEGFALYFCKCINGSGSCRSSSGSSPCEGGSTVVALAKAKTTFYQMRRKVRESLRGLMGDCTFWAATAAAAAAAAAAPAGRPANESGLGEHHISSAVLEAFAAASQAAAAAPAVSRADGGLTAGTLADAEPAGGAAAVEAALRVQVSAVVGMYWCSVLESHLSRFEQRLKSSVHQGPSEPLIRKVLMLMHQGEAEEFPLHELQRRRLNFDSLLREESVNFRRAVAFSCSLVAAVLLALRCLPDPQRVPQSTQELQEQQKQQMEEGIVSDVHIQKVNNTAVFQDLIHGRGMQGEPRGFHRFLMHYVNFRFMDFMADSREFAAATGAPGTWVAPRLKLLKSLQRASSSSSTTSFSWRGQPCYIVRMADLRNASAAVSNHLQRGFSAPVKCPRRKQEEHAQLGLKQLPRIVCLVAPPLLLTASQYRELQNLCGIHGYNLLLRHGTCVTGYCCCYCRRDKCTCLCRVCEKVATGDATAYSCLCASLIVLWGVSEHGNKISLDRLQQLLQQREAQKQQPEQQQKGGYIALVGQRGTIEKVRNCDFSEVVVDGSPPIEDRAFVADRVVGEAILKAESRTVAEGILSLASKCCSGDLLESTMDSCKTTQDLPASLQTTAGTSGRRPAILRLPASLLATECGTQVDCSWFGRFATALEAVAGTARDGDRSPAQNTAKGHRAPLHQAASFHGPVRVGAGFAGGREAMNKFMSSAGLPSEPTPFASVVALLPVSLPGSGKTSVFLEALRPALRQEFMSSNTVSVGGVTGLVIWEGRPLFPARRVKTVAPTTTAIAAVETGVEATATAAAATPAVSGRPPEREAVTATPAPLGSVFDCVCFLSSDEFTGEALRSFGHNAPTGSLHHLCLQEASRAGPAAAARINSPSRPGGTGGPSSSVLDEKIMSAAIAEGRRSMRSALQEFFTQLEDTLVRRFVEEKGKQHAMKEKGSSPAVPYCPLRVLVVLDRNHPPNAVNSRFSEVKDLLDALQSAALMRCGMLVKVATAAVLLPPDATRKGSSMLLRRLGEYPMERSIKWDYPWSIEVVLRCMYRVLGRVDHATLSGGGASGADVAQDVKALHICLSFLSCFKGHSNIHELLDKHPSVTHVLQLQTVLPVEQQHHQQEQKQLEYQQQLLLRALSSLKPFSNPPTNQDVFMALAESLRQFPPDGPLSGDHQANCCVSISRCAGELQQLVDSLFLSMEEPQLRGCDQLLQQQPQPLQPQQAPESQQQRHHDNVAWCGKLQQPQGDLEKVTPEGGCMMPLEEVCVPTSKLILRVPVYFGVSLEGEKEALNSLTQQLLAAAQSAGGSWVPSVADIFKTLDSVHRPHVTTFFLGGGELKTSRVEIMAANEWLDNQPLSLDCSVGSEPPSEGAYVYFSPRILCLHELLASRRQTGLYFRFQVSHLVITDVGLACAALIPLSPVLPLKETEIPKASPSTVVLGGRTCFYGSASVNPVGGPASLGFATRVQEVDAAVGKCGTSCAVCGPHNIYESPWGSQRLCMASYHYPHVTLGVSRGANASMSNDTLAAADAAILQGIREKTLRVDTPRPFRTGGPRNQVGVPEDQAEGHAAKCGYESLNCYHVGDGCDPQELIVLSGVPIGNTRARLWVWSVPEEAREELEGPVQAF